MAAGVAPRVDSISTGATADEMHWSEEYEVELVDGRTRLAEPVLLGSIESDFIKERNPASCDLNTILMTRMIATLPPCSRLFNFVPVCAL